MDQRSFECVYLSLYSVLYVYIVNLQHPQLGVVTSGEHLPATIVLCVMTAASNFYVCLV